MFHHPIVSHAHLATIGEIIAEPKPYQEARRLEHTKHWQEAMDIEYKALMDNNTWCLAPLSPGRIMYSHSE